MTIDSQGNEVKEGDIVQVISIAPKTINNLPEEEQKNLKSMLSERFEVEKIDKYGSAWVTKSWNRNKGESESHSLGLSPSEIILVDKAK